MKAARFKRHTQWLSRAEQLRLAYDFIEMLWPKPLSQWRGAQRIVRAERQRFIAQ